MFSSPPLILLSLVKSSSCFPLPLIFCSSFSLSFSSHPPLRLFCIIVIIIVFGLGGINTLHTPRAMHPWQLWNVFDQFCVTRRWQTNQTLIYHCVVYRQFVINYYNAPIAIFKWPCCYASRFIVKGSSRGQCWVLAFVRLSAGALSARRHYRGAIGAGERAPSPVMATLTGIGRR